MGNPEDYVKRVLKVLIYIEDHIEEELSMDKLAKVACYSSFHFHRIFQAIVGETVHNYVRRLRLERAAGRLLHTERPVTDIALDAAYETPSAFTRAFKQCMGKSPRNYRALYVSVKDSHLEKFSGSDYSAWLFRAAAHCAGRSSESLLLLCPIMRRITSSRYSRGLMLSARQV